MIEIKIILTDNEFYLIKNGINWNEIGEIFSDCYNRGDWKEKRI